MNKKRLLTVLGGSKKTAWSTVFNGTSTVINCGNEASIQNLHGAAFTFEAYMAIATNTDTTGTIAGKGTTVLGWFMRGNTLSRIQSLVSTDAGLISQSSSTSATTNEWRHYALTYNNAGDRKLRLYADGILVLISAAASGTIVTDETIELTIGGYAAASFTNMKCGWVRVSNSIRYSANFTPQSRYEYPAVDANTVRLFKMNEGSGTTIIDYSANAQNATLANGTWIKI